MSLPRHKEENPHLHPLRQLPLLRRLTTASILFGRKSFPHGGNSSRERQRQRRLCDPGERRRLVVLCAQQLPLATRQLNFLFLHGPRFGVNHFPMRLLFYYLNNSTFWLILSSILFLFRFQSRHC